MIFVLVCSCVHTPLVSVVTANLMNQGNNAFTATIHSQYSVHGPPTKLLYNTFLFWFHRLKSQQGLLVDFSAFPQKFIDLLELCIAETGKTSPK